MAVDLHFAASSTTFETAIKDINQTIAGIVIQCVSSSILLGVFLKIYAVVNVREENNAEDEEDEEEDEEDLDYTRMSYVSDLSSS